MTLDEACNVLRSLGYEVYQVPANLDILPAGHWWICNPKPEGDEPWGQEVDDISDRDLVMLAEALKDHHRCFLCSDQAISQCPDCGAWTCDDDRRDFPPDFNDHLCPPCVRKINMANLGTMMHPNCHCSLAALSIEDVKKH